MTLAAHPAVTAAEVLARLDALQVSSRRLTVDSRALVAGDIFVALAGSKTDGRRFVGEALAKGAAAVLREADGASVVASDPRVVDVANLPALLGDIADSFYKRPSASLAIFGVTGTNGKTSIVNWIAQALQQSGTRCGAIGTLGVSLGDEHWPTQNTTPDAATVHTVLRDLQAAGAQAVAMEVSSHALELHRVSGVRFDSVIFTNLTQDHLDFHGTMDAYGAAKAKLFTDYPAKHRIINADDAFGRELLKRGMPNCLSYGLDAGHVRGTVLAMSGKGMDLQIDCAGETANLRTALIGNFNAYNLLAVAATLISRGWPLDRAADALARLTPAPGRMQRVEAAAEAAPAVYVDYAHTPDALLKALDTVRETRPTTVAVVFGCGGDRDRSKRPLMGRIASERADQVFVTSDNPRSEAPDAIITDIMAGIAPSRLAAVQVHPDRRQAIRRAIDVAPLGGAILIAGKGHEVYQEIAGVRHEFSDVEEARTALSCWQPHRGAGSSEGALHVAR